MKARNRNLSVGIVCLLASTTANAPFWIFANESNTEMTGQILLCWLATTFVVASIGAYFAHGNLGHRFTVGSIAFAGVHIVVLLRIIIDSLHDPTSHNLAPFEFIVAALPAGAGASAGAILGAITGLAVSTKDIHNESPRNLCN